MNRTEIAESILAGSLDCDPGQAATFMAEGYLNLVRVVRMTRKHAPDRLQKMVDEFLAVDPPLAPVREHRA